MSDKFVLDSDGSSVQTLELDGSGNGAIKTTENIQPLLDANAKKRAESSTNWAGDLHHVASIPVTVANMWRNELGDDPFAKRNHAWLTAKLNSSDFLGLRTKGGNL